MSIDDLIYAPIHSQADFSIGQIIILNNERWEIIRIVNFGNYSIIELKGSRGIAHVFPADLKERIQDGTFEPLIVINSLHSYRV